MFHRVVDIRPGEGKRTLLAFLILLLIIASYTVVKSVRDALFLSKFGITQLSLIGIGLAVAIGFVISIYLRTTSGVPRHLLILGTNITIAASLALIWIGLWSPGLTALLPWVLYIWSSIFGVFIVMQFWLLANDLFDPREAKRLFGFIGAGAILGGVSGGFLSRGLAGILGTSNLLLVAGGMLIVEAVLVTLVWPLRRRDLPAPSQSPTSVTKRRSSAGGLSALQENRSVRLLAIALLLSTIATTLLDWQFKGITKIEFAGRTDEMAAFFGSLYAYLSLASFLVQTLLTGWVLRRFGIRVGLLALPVSLMLGSSMILAYALIPWLSLLAAATSAKVAEGGLRFSIDKASMELMWLPVPPNIKEKGKSFVDTVVDRLGTGVTGFIWLGLAALGLDSASRIHLISFVVVALIFLWLVVLLNARSAYLQALRDALSSRKLDLDRLHLDLVDAEARRTLTESLSSTEPREVLFALYLLEDQTGKLPDISAALTHDDATVRIEAIKLLIRKGDHVHRRRAIDCLTHSEDSVREAAISYLHSTATPTNDPLVEELAANDQVDKATVDVIKLGMPAYAMTAANEIRAILESDDPARRLSMIRLLGAAPPEMAAALLAPSLEVNDYELVCATLVATGRSRAAGLVPQLASLLENKRYRRRATSTLISIGSASVDHLLLLLGEGKLSPAAMSAAAQVLGASARADVVPHLMNLLTVDGTDISRRALRALNRLKKNAGFQLGPEQSQWIKQLIDGEVEALYRDLLFLNKGSWADFHQEDRPVDYLSRTLGERVDGRVERIFRLLALSHNPDDIYAAYRGVRSPIKTIRANSIEFLDNLLPKDFTARFIPLLENAGASRFAQAAREQGIPAAEDRTALLRRLLNDSDTLLRSVASWTVGVEHLKQLRPELEALVKSSSDITPVVKRALQRLDARDWEEPTMGLTAIEKALKLQQVDVLQQASTEDLSYIAQIAKEEQFSASQPIYSEGDLPDALYVVIAGRVRLHREDVEIAVLGEGEAFGSWALLDESPRVASATAVDDVTLLKVSREEFLEVLADRVDIVQAIFKAMVERLRSLASAASNL